MIKVVHLQYSVESAGSAALRLQIAFGKVNVQSNIVSLQHGTMAGPSITYLGKKERILARIDEKIRSFFISKTHKEYGLFSYPLLGTDVSQLSEIKDADFIYIHWVLNGFLNFKSIEQIAKLKKPVIIFMHDMWDFSGGCHYSFDCEKYKTGCHNCQMFPGNKENDLSARGFNKKKKLYTKYNNLYFTAPSKWLYNCAKESALTKDKPVFYIPNLLDNTIYKPFDKKIARQILNIDQNCRVVAFGAVSVNSPYKGWPYLQKALELLKEDNQFENITVLIFGSGHNKAIADAIPFKTKFMGYLKDEYSTALVYNAADVFVAPSVMEAFGYVIMEALCCGTPVVGFNVGGIPDMVKHKENGYIAKYKDADDVCNGIKFCLQNNLKGNLPPALEPGLTITKHLELFKHIQQQKLK